MKKAAVVSWGSTAVPGVSEILALEGGEVMRSNITSVGDAMSSWKQQTSYTARPTSRHSGASTHFSGLATSRLTQVAGNIESAWADLKEGGGDGELKC